MTERTCEAPGALARSSRLDLTALLSRAAPALLVIGVWLLFHSYKGVMGDARLYVAQAMHWRHPEIFDRDLFFAFGSQDAFTIFSPLLAFLIEHLGLTASSMLITIAGHVLWLSAAAALALRIAPERSAAVTGLVLVAGLSPFYGAWVTLAYGEGFVTPRLLVEGLSLWALHALSQRRLALALALVVPALLLHPLVTAAVLCAGFAFLVAENWRWGVLGLAGLAAAAVLVAIGISPFDRLAQTIDPEWFAVLAARSVYIFPSMWTVADLSRTALVSATALASATLLDGWRRRMMLAVLASGLGGMLVTYIGADILHNLFIAQVQLYRTLWVLYPFAYLGAGLLLTRIWRAENGRLLASLYLAAWLICLIIEPASGAVIGMATLGFMVARLRGIAPPLPPRACAALACALGIAIGLVTAFRVHMLVKGIGYPSGHPLHSAFPTLLDAALAATLVGLLWHYRPSLARRAWPVATLLLVMIGASLWDRRDPWVRVMMEPDLRTPFEAYLAPDARVFWEDDVRGAWLVLKRPAYVSQAHGAGIVFTRQTALTYRDRAQIMRPLGSELVATWGLVAEPLPALDRATLVAVCRAAPELDAMVLSREVEGSVTVAWDLPVPLYDKRTIPDTGIAAEIRRLYLYRCAELR